MPRYTLDIVNESDKFILGDDQIRKMYDACDNDYELLLLCIAWLTGARTTEIIRIQRGDIDWDDDNIYMAITTLKLRKHKNRKRELTFKRIVGHQDQLYIDTITQILEGWDFKFGKDLERRIIPKNDRWVRDKIKKIGMKAIELPICIYTIRHSVFSHLGSSGIGLKELQAFKGAASVASVIGYLHERPMIVDYSKINRSRWLSSRTRPEVNNFHEEDNPLVKSEQPAPQSSEQAPATAEQVAEGKVEDGKAETKAEEPIESGQVAETGKTEETAKS